MSAVSPYCSRCGSELEEDCDFCPSCGSPRQISKPAYDPVQKPHSWMGDTPNVVTPLHQGDLMAKPDLVPVVPAQVHYVPYPINSAHGQVQDSGLANTGRTMGIIAISLMFVGLIPCVGWLNYINIPFSFATIVLCIVAAATAKAAPARSSAIIGLVLAIISDGVGFIRLIIGGGCL
jgi:hypothetical protein